MTDSLRETRAAELCKWLMETKKAYTRTEIGEHFGWHTQTLQRIIDKADSYGMLEIDKARAPFLYRYRKGASPNFFPPFTFTDKPQEQLAIRDLCNGVLQHATDWQPVQSNLGSHLIYAMVFGLALDETDHISQYNEFLDAVAEN